MKRFILCAALLLSFSACSVSGKLNTIADQLHEDRKAADKFRLKNGRRTMCGAGLDEWLVAANENPNVGIIAPLMCGANASGIFGGTSQ